MKEISVPRVHESTKHEWVREILSIEEESDLTLQLSDDIFLWIERYNTKRDGSGEEILLVEVVKGHWERDVDGKYFNVFEKVIEKTYVPFMDVKLVVDEIIDVFDSYVCEPVTIHGVLTGLAGLFGVAVMICGLFVVGVILPPS